MSVQSDFVRFGSVALVQPDAITTAAANPAPKLLDLAAALETTTDLHVAVLPLGNSPATGGDAPRQWARVIDAWAGLRLTTVAALDGRLTNVWVALAAVLDFRIAGRSTLLTTYCCGTQPRCLHPRLAEVCGQVRSFELSPHHPIRAPEAMMAGLVDDVVPPGAAVTEALRWAQRIAGRPEATRIMAKLAIRQHRLRSASADDDGSDCPVPEPPDKTD